MDSGLRRMRHTINGGRASRFLVTAVTTSFENVKGWGDVPWDIPVKNVDVLHLNQVSLV